MKDEDKLDLYKWCWHHYDFVQHVVEGNYGFHSSMQYTDTDCKGEWVEITVENSNRDT